MNPVLSADDLYLFNEGSHDRLYTCLGAHLVMDPEPGVHFAVWAPNAARVSVVGDFNGWQPGRHPMAPQAQSGIHAVMVPGVAPGAVYKFHIESRHDGYRVDKADPLAFATEAPPHTGSVVTDLEHAWGDGDWMARGRSRAALDRAMNVYELHLGSWMRDLDNRPFSYRELAGRITEYVVRMGFTHVEFLPVMEHPFHGSWGYQVTGYFAPTSRYGTPSDLMYLIDTLHQAGVGVLLDWVPSHFPTDEFALGFFDGTHLYEHADRRRGFHPDWNTFIFNYGRPEVRSFLQSSAMFWLDLYHADGLRVDAVASMLYLDYSRPPGAWIPNERGGRENLDAIGFLRELNSDAYARFPEVQTVAEESTSWPMVSRPVHVGGLGFGMKWDMGWMHDMLEYLGLDPVHRAFHHNALTFRSIYAFTENFMLPLSHDEVVHGKGSLVNKMAGDEWQKFANLRLLFAAMYLQPGKKLVFMGGEFGQKREWNHDIGLDWHLLAEPLHAGVQALVRDLNRLTRELPALHALDFSSAGFEWVDANDSAQSVVSWLRFDNERKTPVLAVLNCTPVPRANYRVGVPMGGRWDELINTDAVLYGGSGVGNLGAVIAVDGGHHGRSHSLVLQLPPLAALVLGPGGARTVSAGAIATDGA